jgi:hypothetical protein
MTIEQRVEDLIVALFDGATSLHEARTTLRTALIETARDQRHACAEAVNEINAESRFLDKAHQVIMNTELK